MQVNVQECDADDNLSAGLAADQHAPAQHRCSLTPGTAQATAYPLEIIVYSYIYRSRASYTTAYQALWCLVNSHWL